MIQHCPTPTELDDLELLVSGAYAPLDALQRAREPGDARACPRVSARPSWSTPRACRSPGSRSDGTLEPLTHAQYGPFRRLHLTPAQAREQHAGATFVPVVDALTDAELDEVRSLGRVVLVALTGTGTPALSPVALVRATLAAAELLDDAAVIAVPLPSHGDADRRPRARRAGGRDLRRRATRCTLSPTRPASESLPRRRRRDRRGGPAPRRRRRGSCCSSPASPAAASRPSPRP